MLNQISDLGDETLGKNAALHIIQHAAQSKDLDYVVKRLVGGLQSTKLSTKSGCYATLCGLLRLQNLKLDNVQSVIKNQLVTNKESSKKERRLTYIARLLAYGSVLRTVSPDTIMSSPEFVSDCFSSIVDLCEKKHVYVTVAVPFLSHFLPLLTQDQFETVRPHVMNLVDGNNQMVGASSRIMVALSVSKFVNLPVLQDLKTVAKALVASRIEFEDSYVAGVFDRIKSSETQVTEFWNELMSCIKSTQFETLCVCVESALEHDIPVSWFVTKSVVKALISVFSRNDFEGNPKSVISRICEPNRIVSLPDSDRKKILDVLFGEFPNVLAEYKYVSNCVKVLVQGLGEHDLEFLHQILISKLENSGARAIIIVLQLLGKVCSAQHCSDHLSANILLKLVGLATGAETINYKVNEGGQPVQPLIKSCCGDVVVSVLSSGVRVGVFELVRKQLEHGKVKAVAKACKKSVNEEFKVVAWSLVVRDIVAEVKATEMIDTLLEVGDSDADVVRFLVNDVLRLVNPAVNHEAIFTRMIVQNRVDSSVVSVIAEFIDVQDGGDEGSDDDDSSDDDSDNEQPISKKIKIDDVHVQNLKEQFGNDSNDSNSDDSIALDDATDQDLSRMDTALANVFRIKRTMKEEKSSLSRSLTRTYRLINIYVTRNIKCMDVGSLVILLPPIVHSITHLMKERKHTDVVTKLISTLDNVNRVRRFSNYDGIESMVLVEVAKDIIDTSRVKKYGVIRDLLEHTVLLVTRAFIGNESKSKKEESAFVKMYVMAVELAKNKIKKRKANRGFETSRFVRLAIQQFDGSWSKGVKKIKAAIDA